MSAPLDEHGAYRESDDGLSINEKMAGDEDSNIDTDHQLSRGGVEEVEEEKSENSFHDEHSSEVEITTPATVGRPVSPSPVLISESHPTVQDNSFSKRTSLPPPRMVPDVPEHAAESDIEEDEAKPHHSLPPHPMVDHEGLYFYQCLLL